MSGSAFAKRKQFVFAGIAAALVAAGFAAGAAYAAQPRMRAALGYLQNAKAELQAAAADKGGHRLRAIELVNQAMGEVQAGIAAGM